MPDWRPSTAPAGRPGLLPVGASWCTWARFRRTNGSLKLHTLLDHDGYLPAFVALSPAREHDVQRARSLRLPKGSIVAEDMGYADYDRYAQLSPEAQRPRRGAGAPQSQ